MPRRHAALAVLVLLLAGCASAGPATRPSVNPDVTREIIQGYETALEGSAKLHDRLTFAAGAAHASGLLTDAQLEEARSGGKALEEALRLAQVAAAAYLRSGGSVTAASEATSAFWAARKSESSLLTLLRRRGVIP